MQELKRAHKYLAWTAGRRRKPSTKGTWPERTRAPQSALSEAIQEASFWSFPDQGSSAFATEPRKLPPNRKTILSRFAELSTVHRVRRLDFHEVKSVGQAFCVRRKSGKAVPRAKSKTRCARRHGGGAPSGAPSPQGEGAPKSAGTTS